MTFVSLLINVILFIRSRCIVEDIAIVTGSTMHGIVVTGTGRSRTCTGYDYIISGITVKIVITFTTVDRVVA